MRFLAILTALAIAVGAGACGSDGGSDDGQGGSQTTAGEPLSKDAYLEQLNAAQTRFANDAAELDLANPSSAKDFGNSLDQLNGLIDTLRERLAAIAAPEQVAAEQADLVRQLRVYGKAIERQKGALTSGDAQRAAAAARKVGAASNTFSREFDATIAQINDNLGLDPGTPSD